MNPWFLALVVFLAVFLTFMIIYNAILLNNRVNPSDCPVVAGDFGVRTGLTGTILKSCGTDQAQACTFSQITSLSQAIDLCNQNVNVCRVFSYSASTANLSFIDPNSALTTSSNSDLYARQFAT